MYCFVLYTGHILKHLKNFFSLCLAVYPDKCNISVAAISDIDLYNKHVTYWDDVYGFKMTCMKACVVREANVAVVNKDSVITDACIVKVNSCSSTLFIC